MEHDDALPPTAGDPADPLPLVAPRSTSEGSGAIPGIAVPTDGEAFLTIEPAAPIAPHEPTEPIEPDAVADLVPPVTCIAASVPASAPTNAASVTLSADADTTARAEPPPGDTQLAGVQKPAPRLIPVLTEEPPVLAPPTSTALPADRDADAAASMLRDDSASADSTSAAALVDPSPDHFVEAAAATDAEPKSAPPAVVATSTSVSEEAVTQGASQEASPPVDAPHPANSFALADQATALLLPLEAQPTAPLTPLEDQATAPLVPPPPAGEPAFPEASPTSAVADHATTPPANVSTLVIVARIPVERPPTSAPPVLEQMTTGELFTEPAVESVAAPAAPATPEVAAVHAAPDIWPDAWPEVWADDGPDDWLDDWPDGSPEDGSDDGSNDWPDDRSRIAGASDWPTASSTVASAEEPPHGEPSLGVVAALRREMEASAAMGRDRHATTSRHLPRRDPHAYATRPLPRRRHRRHPLALTIVEVLLVFIVAFGGTYVAFDAHARLNQARLLAHDGLQHLEDIRTLFAGSDKLAAALNTTTLARAARDLTAAQGDFARLGSVIQQGSFGIAAHTPFTSDPLQAATDLAAAAVEACQGGLLAIQGMQLVAPVVAGGIFSGSSATNSASTLTTTTVTQLTAALDGALHHLDTAIADAQRANLAALPSSLVSAQQRQQLQEAIAQWPTLRPVIVQAQGFLADVPALLGLTTPANYLIELMDRTELRPGGGFIGNYAVMTIAKGKIQPFTISDTYLLDKPYLSAHGGQAQAPAAFSWWRWAGFYGLRDSNFSADYPTSAQQGMLQLAREGGPKTQGVIALTVPAIARVLQVVGSVPMPQYNQTVTAQNLESLIHYYQEAVGHDPLTGLPRSDLLSSSRKRFTALLARALLDKLHGLSSTQLVAIGKNILLSMQLKEIQVYLGVPRTEALLAQHGLDGAVTHGPGDGVTIVDANATANKANQFVSVTYRDTVTLDANGTATHQLTITYQFAATDRSQLFGQDLYETYLRIYVPPGAQLTHLDGLHNTFGQDQINHSDLSWRQMWGGYVLVQDGKPYVLHVSWRVPQAAMRDAAGNWTYALTYQHQAGANQVLILAVNVPGQRIPAIQYNATLDSNRAFTATYHST